MVGSLVSVCLSVYIHIYYIIWYIPYHVLSPHIYIRFLSIHMYISACWFHMHIWTNTNQLENTIENKIPFVIAIKKYRDLGINLARNMQDIWENYRIPWGQRRISGEIPYFWMKKLKIIKMWISSKLPCKFWPNSNDRFWEFARMTPKFRWHYKHFKVPRKIFLM